MAQLQLKILLGKVNAILEKSHNFFGFVVIKKDELTNLLDEIAQCVPADIKEAEMIISHKEELVKESQNKADRIIQEAVNEQARLVNENEIVKRAQDAVANQKQQVEQYCENLQNTAIKNAEEIRVTAIRESATIQNQANEYAARVFNGVGANLMQMLESVKTCQQALAAQIQKQNAPAQQETVQENPNSNSAE